MPLYEYSCESCKAGFEEKKGMNDPLPQCPGCGGDVKQVLSPPLIRFTGTGFYATDYPKGKGEQGGTK